MSEQLVYVGMFLVVFASVPLLLKRFLRNTTNSQSGLVKSTRIVSIVGVGPNQRVVTLEVGPEDKRLLLVLGVSAQNIVCLHKFATDPSADISSLDSDIGVAKSTKVTL